MSNEEQNDSGGRKPDYLAYHVRESADGKGYWNKVGTAWRHRDGQGYDVQLDSVPVDGRVTLRELREDRMRGYEDQRQRQVQDEARNPEQGRARGRRRGYER